MPLHLLGKKSWNVYNPASIARVQRDEAEAHKREQEEERRQRQDEASDRLAILRGERDQTILSDPKAEDSSRRDRESSRHRALKKRKLPGEDDTDLEIRLAQAQADAALSSNARGNTSSKPTKSQEHSITDANGNISLVPSQAYQDQQQQQPNKKADPNPSHFYLSSAAAHGSSASDVPWYNSTDTNQSSSRPAKEPWGAASPRRAEREAARQSSNDPLAAMKRGIKQLRDSERQRKEWRELREKDLREVEELARRRDRDRGKRKKGDEDGGGSGRSRAAYSRRGRDERRKRKESHAGGDEPAEDSEADSLDGFDLDNGYAKAPEKEKGSRRHSHNDDERDHRRHHHRHRHGHSHRSHRHHRHRSRSRSRSPRRE